MGVLSQLERVL